VPAPTGPLSGPGSVDAPAAARPQAWRLLIDRHDPGDPGHRSPGASDDDAVLQPEQRWRDRG